jgi:hypothetical protein
MKNTSLGVSMVEFVQDNVLVLADASVFGKADASSAIDMGKIAKRHLDAEASR